MNAVRAKVPDFINDHFWKFYDSQDLYYSVRDSRIFDDDEVREKEQIPLTERITDRNYIKIGTREEYVGKDPKSLGKQLWFLDRGYLLKSWGLIDDKDLAAAILIDDEWQFFKSVEDFFYHVSYNKMTLEITHLTFYVADKKTRAVRLSYTIEV